MKFFKIQPKLNIQPNQFCQFFVVLHKIGHDRATKLHGRSPQITKKTKYGNLYNDRTTLKNRVYKYYKHDFFNQLCQYFVVLYKIWHDRTTKLHGRSPQISKKNKLGNLYNDRSTLKNGNQKTRFFNVDRSLYKFPCFAFLVT